MACQFEDRQSSYLLPINETIRSINERDELFRGSNQLLNLAPFRGFLTATTKCCRRVGGCMIEAGSCTSTSGELNHAVIQTSPPRLRPDNHEI